MYEKAKKIFRFIAVPVIIIFSFICGLLHNRRTDDSVRDDIEGIRDDNTEIGTGLEQCQSDCKEAGIKNQKLREVLQEIKEHQRVENNSISH